MPGQWPLPGPGWGRRVHYYPSPAGLRPGRAAGARGPPVKAEIVLPQAPTASLSVRSLRQTRGPAPAFALAAGPDLLRHGCAGPGPRTCSSGEGPEPGPGPFSAGCDLGGPPAGFSGPKWTGTDRRRPGGAHKYLTRFPRLNIEFGYLTRLRLLNTEIGYISARELERSSS